MQYRAENENKFYFDVSAPEWYNVTVRVVCNSFTGSSSNNDGIIEGYINGHLISRTGGLHLLDYSLRDTKIYELFWRNFTGGGFSGCIVQDQWFYIDDIYVFTYDISVDVPRGNELSPPDRVLNLPNWPKE